VSLLTVEFHFPLTVIRVAQFCNCLRFHHTQDTEYGCCSDGKTPASGEQNEGCPRQESPTSCSESPFGCCPDGVTPAGGDNNEGCPADETEEQSTVAVDGTTTTFVPAVHIESPGCLHSTYGCCSDHVTPREGDSSLPSSCLTNTVTRLTMKKHLIRSLTRHHRAPV
jgi:hypothetical protein